MLVSLRGMALEGITVRKLILFAGLHRSFLQREMPVFGIEDGEIIVGIIVRTKLLLQGPFDSQKSL